MYVYRLSHGDGQPEWHSIFVQVDKMEPGNHSLLASQLASYLDQAYEYFRLAELTEKPPPLPSPPLAWRLLLLLSKLQMSAIGRCPTLHSTQPILST